MTGLVVHIHLSIKNAAFLYGGRCKVQEVTFAVRKAQALSSYFKSQGLCSEGPMRRQSKSEACWMVVTWWGGDCSFRGKKRRREGKSRGESCKACLSSRWEKSSVHWCGRGRLWLNFAIVQPSPWLSSWATSLVGLCFPATRLQAVH